MRKKTIAKTNPIRIHVRKRRTTSNPVRDKSLNGTRKRRQLVDGIMKPTASKPDSEPTLKELFAKMTVIVLIIGLNWVGLSAIGTTYSYYNDTETSNDNTLIAGQLDFILDQSAWMPALGELDLQPGNTISQDVTIVDVDDLSIEFKYIVWPVMTGGDVDFCNALELDAYLEGNSVYSGALFDFPSATTTFATTTTNTWKFDVSLPEDAPDFADNSCEFDFVYSGWQIRFPNEGEGYHDVEMVSNTIGQQPVPVGQCDALSIGYWRNHDGCSKGSGESIWTSEVNNLSSTTLSGFFAEYLGEDICEALWVPNCPGGNSAEAKRCKAKAVTLADELNIVSDRLQTSALIAGADDGDSAFDSLGLSATSTVEEALVAVEDILKNSEDTGEIRDAGHVAERIYAFYEEENTIAPYCIFSESELIVMNEMLPNPEGSDHQDGILGEWVELYNIGSTTIDVEGWTISELSDPDGAATEKFYTIVATSSPSVGEVRTLSGSTVISGAGFLVVLFEAQRLNNTGDTVTLYDSDSNLIDQHKYIDGEAPEGKSIARDPDGFGDWVDPIPTPGSENIMEDEVSGTLDAFIDLAVGFIVVDGSAEATTADTEAPIITIQGNNPAYISLGATYSDLGATVTDNVNDNLGISVSVDDVEVVGGYGEITLDTSTSTTYAITYSATDQAGNTGEDTRLVVVYDPVLGIPEEEVIVEEVVEEPVATGGGGSGGASSGDEPTDPPADSEEEVVIEVIEIPIEDGTATSTATTTEEVIIEEPVVVEEEIILLDDETTATTTTATTTTEVVAEEIIEIPVEETVATSTATTTEEVITEEPADPPAEEEVIVVEEVPATTEEEVILPEEEPATIEPEVLPEPVDESTPTIQ